AAERAAGGAPGAESVLAHGGAGTVRDRAARGADGGAAGPGAGAEPGLPEPDPAGVATARAHRAASIGTGPAEPAARADGGGAGRVHRAGRGDRKSTRLNSSHVKIS